MQKASVPEGGGLVRTSESQYEDNCDDDDHDHAAVPDKEVNGQFQQDQTRNKQCAASQLCRHQRVHDAHVQTAPGR